MTDSRAELVLSPRRCSCRRKQEWQVTLCSDWSHDDPPAKKLYILTSITSISGIQMLLQAGITKGISSDLEGWTDAYSIIVEITRAMRKETAVGTTISSGELLLLMLPRDRRRKVSHRIMEEVEGPTE